MQESGGRRMLITFIFESGSIVALSDGELQEWERVELLSDYIAQKRRERGEGSSVESSGQSAVYGTIDTNLGLFRAYAQLYINSLPQINKSMLSMVRLLEPNENGIPCQLYCFSMVTEWKGYEAVRSEITEHIFSASKMFGLRVFQNASGYHYLSEAYITVGKNIPG
jgi:miniconductance mechanosensitive channel